ncbi:MAG: hypothetical protein JWM68_3267 [Verrucomicrobiales bacterium]|nr:hypothetical protein [Verrucomicrobiales bacterium]
MYVQFFTSERDTTGLGKKAGMRAPGFWEYKPPFSGSGASRQNSETSRQKKDTISKAAAGVRHVRICISKVAASIGICGLVPSK